MKCDHANLFWALWLTVLLFIAPIKMKDVYCVGALGAILMYDTQEKVSYQALDGHFKNLTGVHHDGLPTVVVGNKAEVKKGNKKETTFQRKHRLQHYEVSIKSGWNFEEPLRWLAKKLTGYNRLRFVTGPEKRSAEDKPVAKSDVAPSTSEVAEAAKLSLPPSTDEDGL